MKKFIVFAFMAASLFADIKMSDSEMKNMKAAARAKLFAITKKQKIIQDTLTMMAKAETQRLHELEKKILTSMQSERLYKSVFEMTAKGYEGGIVSVFEHTLIS